MTRSARLSNTTESRLTRAEVDRALGCFQASHQRRHAQTLSHLAASQARIVQALPLLIHINDPNLPGFVPSAPSGICNYTPVPVERYALRRLVTSAPVPTPGHQQQILAVFYMGSAGTAAQTRSSDIDLWVVVIPEHLALMQRKLTRLADWCGTQGIELQPFAVTTQQFRGGRDLQNSPLLLDEFYRSACWLAGHPPSWWIIPPSAGAQHRRLLRAATEEGVINADQFVDFGPIPEFSARDLTTAAIVELQRTASSPHKALLKIALLETYAAGWPSLAEHYKSRLLDGAAPQALDPYLLLAQRIDAYFAASPVRLRFLRRAWLQKSGRGNARLTQDHPWWQQARHWNFTQPAELSRLRFKEDWTLSELFDESRRLQDAIQQGLSFIGQLLERCRTEHPAHALADLNAEYAAVRDKFQRGHKQNDHIASTLATKRYSIKAHIERCGDDWVVREGDFIREFSSFAQLVHWLVNSQVGVEKINPSSPAYAVLRQVLDIFTHQEGALLINPDVLLDRSLAGQELTLLSSEDDPLCYGRAMQCLVTGLDVIARNRPPSQTRSLINVLTELINDPHEIAIVASADLMQQRIARRVRSLLAQCRQSLRVADQAVACQIGIDTVVLHHSDSQVVCHTLQHGETMRLPPGTRLIRASRQLPDHICI